jgi:hypothetical protein
MQLGAQSWDFGVNITNTLQQTPHTPGGRISTWLQNAQPPTPSQQMLPGSPWSSRHPPGYGQKWDYQPCAGCTPNSRTRDLANSAKNTMGSPIWSRMAQPDKMEAVRAIHEAQRARLRGEQPQGVIARNADLMASCPHGNWGGGGGGGGDGDGDGSSVGGGGGGAASQHHHEVGAPGTPMRRRDIERLAEHMENSNQPLPAAAAAAAQTPPGLWVDTGVGPLNPAVAGVHPLAGGGGAGSSSASAASAVAGAPNALAERPTVSPVVTPSRHGGGCVVDQAAAIIMQGGGVGGASAAAAAAGGGGGSLVGGQAAMAMDEGGALTAGERTPTESSEQWQHSSLGTLTPVAIF